MTSAAGHGFWPGACYEAYCMQPDCPPISAETPLVSPLVDGRGRVHDSLRISVTDRCNIRCFYCMPAGGIAWKPAEDILSLEEIERFAKIAARLGIKKIRITGGEPLVRKNLSWLIRQLAGIPGIRDVSITTNGVLLAGFAQELRDAGLRRINVHLDTLDRERYRQITRRDDLDRVLQGLCAAQKAGFSPIKINSVMVRNQSESDIVPMARFGRENGFQVRFIEFMPLDSQGAWDRSRIIENSEILAMLSHEFGPLTPAPDADRHSPADLYRYADGRGQIGFIEAVTKSFCRNCNRLRLTADGKLRSCLFSTVETPIRDVLRTGADREVEQALRDALLTKRSGHSINTPQFVPPPRPMYSIGG